jgi:hypothetical protein
MKKTIGEVNNMINYIVQGIFALGSGFLAHQKEVVIGKREVEINKIKAEATVAKHLAEITKVHMDADSLAIINKRTSYKDDVLFWIIVASIVYPWFDPARAMEIAKVYSNYPAWLMLIIVGVFIGVFGLRSMFDPLSRFLGKK